MRRCRKGNVIAITPASDTKSALIEKYIKDSRSAPLSGWFIAHGPPSSGKTRFAATASKLFPERVGEKWVKLEDICYLTFDAGALDGLKVEKLEIPFVDGRHLMADMGAVKGTFASLELLEHLLDTQKGVKYVCVDTVSEMSDQWKEQFARPDPSNTRSIYSHLDATHLRFQSQISKICGSRGVIPIYLSHSKARVLMADATEAQKATAQADRLPGGNAIGLDIDGAGRHIYTRNATLVFAVRCKRGGKGKPDTYEVLPRGGDEFEGKDRLARVLSENEPSNLRAIFNKIDAATKD